MRPVSFCATAPTASLQMHARHNRQLAEAASSSVQNTTVMAAKQVSAAPELACTCLFACGVSTCVALPQADAVALEECARAAEPDMGQDGMGAALQALDGRFHFLWGIYRCIHTHIVGHSVIWHALST